MNANHPLLTAEFDGLAQLPLPWEELRGKRIAVTGATGLIGASFLRAVRAVSDRLGLDIRLIALCRWPERLPDIPNLDFMPYDARLPLTDGLRADYILHAASNAHPLAFSSDPVGTMQANLLGTMHLLENVRENGGRLLLCSTGEVYGQSAEVSAYDEATFGAVDPMRPRSCYPESKRAAETLCAAYHAQYGADALAARLCYVYGPAITAENSRADAQFLRRALAGEDIALKSDGSQLRSYCYAQDAVSALLTLMLRGEAGQAYNVAGEAAAIREYAGTLAQLAGVSLRFELPPEEERKGYSTVTRAVQSADKLMALGWVPRYDLREGLSHTLQIGK